MLRTGLLVGCLVALLAVSGCAPLDDVAADEAGGTGERVDQARAAVEAPPTPVAPEPTGVPAGVPSPEPKAATPAPAGVPAGAQAAVVEDITDGDTISVRIDEPGGPLAANASHTIRLLEIDTPETVHPAEGVQCWGPEASTFTGTELPVGSTIYLVADEEDIDRYGRYLRYAWTSDGEFFNELAVRQGYAEAALYEPNDAHIDALRAAEAEARAADRGMWGPPCDYDGSAHAPAPEPQAQPAPAPAAPDRTAGCEHGYDPCVPAYPPDVNCADVDGPIAVTGSDPHGLDRDRDGIGCEG